MARRPIIKDLTTRLEFDILSLSIEETTEQFKYATGGGLIVQTNIKPQTIIQEKGYTQTRLWFQRAINFYNSFHYRNHPHICSIHPFFDEGTFTHLELDHYIEALYYGKENQLLHLQVYVNMDHEFKSFEHKKIDQNWKSFVPAIEKYFADQHPEVEHIDEVCNIFVLLFSIARLIRRIVKMKYTAITELVLDVKHFKFSTDDETSVHQAIYNYYKFLRLLLPKFAITLKYIN